jgi:hypothetical protein
MIICKKCHHADVQVAMWCNPNTKEVVEENEPVFDYNEAPNTIQTQWCPDCKDECEVMESTKEITLRTYFGHGKMTGILGQSSDKNKIYVEIRGEVRVLVRDEEGDAWCDDNGKRWETVGIRI